MIDGELFYTDNQGDWVGSGSIIQIKKGSFTGHPSGLKWANMPNSPVKFTDEKIFAHIKPRHEVDQQGRPVKPENIVNEKFKSAYEMKQYIPELQLPAVWLPHGILGVSNSEIVKIPEGSFGPFEGQLLVGDQGQSMISRVMMEKIKGEYQGAAIAFRSGFQSGVVRMAWAHDGSLFVGETNRGWGSAGEASMGVQRLVWNGRVPFEMKTIKAMPDGFEIEFTRPADKKSIQDLTSYSVENYIYKYHSVYGSPPVNKKACNIKGVKISDDGMKARIIVDNLRQYYIHTITLDGVRDKENFYSLVHPTAYYTLNNIPDGPKLSMKEMSTYRSGLSKSSPVKSTNKITVATNKKADAESLSPTAASVKPLLVKHTCTACHNETTRQVGPAFSEISKRRYSVEKILSLIKNPQPENWPGYSTPMPPMPQVPQEDARKIASWIRSLDLKK
jgi:cytochrome c551/c552